MRRSLFQRSQSERSLSQLLAERGGRISYRPQPSQNPSSSAASTNSRVTTSSRRTPLTIWTMDRPPYHAGLNQRAVDLMRHGSNPRCHRRFRHGRAIVAVWPLGYSQTRASSVSQVSPAGLTTQVGFIRLAHLRIRTRANPSSVVHHSFTIAYAKQMDARVKPAHDDLWVAGCGTAVNCSRAAAPAARSRRCARAPSVTAGPRSRCRSGSRHCRNN